MKISLPDGLYKGTAGKQTSWQGKKFDRKNKNGINVFKKNNKTYVAYPFKTYVGKALFDKNLDVIKIDYNLPGNPLWLRFILDEIVEVAPNKFLGEVNLRILPFWAVKIGQFELEPVSL